MTYPAPGAAAAVAAAAGGGGGHRKLARKGRKASKWYYNAL